MEEVVKFVEGNPYIGKSINHEEIFKYVKQEKGRTIYKIVN
jgi:hypothetical protein